MNRPRWLVRAVVLAGYLAVSLVFLWPLSLHPASRLPGSPDGDLGVYVWNLWVFQHEIGLGHFPLFTSMIFSLDSVADLSLHNYTIFANLVAVPLLPLLGVVATFNLVQVAIFVLNACLMFLLAEHLTRRPAVAWLAGLLFGFSPTLVARSTAHASLVTAAPLPLFLLILLRLDATGSRRWAVAAGATLAWAACCDPYYGVYCVVLAACYLASRMFHVERGSQPPAAARRGPRAIDAAIAGLALVMAAIWLTGGGTPSVFGHPVGLRTVYTPALLLTCLVSARLLMTLRPRVTLRASHEWARLLRLAPYGAGTACVLLSPLLYALLRRAIDGRYVSIRVFWRTSTPGVDLLSLVAPNPNNPWLGAASRAWLSTQPGGYAENVASVTFVALAVIALAVRYARFRPPAFWTGLALLAASLTLGPFVHLAGLNTAVLTPWALLRYVPLIGSARAPARFAVLVILAVSGIFALALKALLERYPSRRRAILVAVGALVLIELFPAPRPSASALIPAIYDRIARDPRDVRVLELPFGVRDGLSSAGNFSARSQFSQTRHHKRLIGGYLSRVSRRRVEMIRRRPVLNALMLLSEGRTLPTGEVARLAPYGRRLVRQADIGYVVVDRTRCSAELINFAVRVLALEKIDQAGSRDLYRPALAPATLQEPAGIRMPDIPRRRRRVVGMVSGRPTPAIPARPPRGVQGRSQGTQETAVHTRRVSLGLGSVTSMVTKNGPACAVPPLETPRTNWTASSSGWILTEPTSRSASC